MTLRKAAPETADWQRLSPWAVGFLFLRVIVDFARNNIPALAGAGAGITFIERIGLREIAVGGALIALVVLLVCLVYYRRFAFRVDGDTLRVRKGVVERTELKVRAERIQHIAVEQPLYLRCFGLVRLRLDTPGAAAAQVELPGIRAELAAALRARLGAAAEEAGSTAQDAESAAEQTQPLYQARGAAILRHGAASNYAYVLAAGVAPFLGEIERLLRWWLSDSDLAAALDFLDARPWLSGAAIAFGVLAVLVTLSVAVAWFRFHGFTLSRTSDRLVQRSGLLNRHEQALSRSRLQAIEHVQTVAGRVLGCSHLICRQIGAVLPGEESAGRSFLIPGLTPARANAMIGELWPEAAAAVTAGPGERVSRRYMRALTLRFSALGVLLAAVGAGLLATPEPLAAVAIVIPLAIAAAWLRWRAVSFQASGGFVQVRRGLLGWRSTVFPEHNVQRVTVHANWFQRRYGVADLTYTLASGAVTIPWIPRQRIDILVNTALYRAEAASPVTLAAAGTDERAAGT